MVLNSDEKKAKGLFKKANLISDNKSYIHIKKYVEAKNINKYKINRIRWLEWNTSRVPKFISRPTFPELYDIPKILITKIGDLKATLDYDKLYCDQTIRILALWKFLIGVNNNSINNSIKRWCNHSRDILEKNSAFIDYKYLLSILNSKLGNYFLNEIRGFGNIDINPEYLKNIPIRTINFNNIHEKQMHDKMVYLVEQMLEMNKRLDSVQTQHEKELLKRRIDATDRHIDKLVYELYGLTEEEINIVEKSA